MVCDEAPGVRALFGSVHLVPGLTQADYAAMAEQFLKGMPKKGYCSRGLQRPLCLGPGSYRGHRIWA